MHNGYKSFEIVSLTKVYIRRNKTIPYEYIMNIHVGFCICQSKIVLNPNFRENDYK